MATFHDNNLLRFAQETYRYQKVLLIFSVFYKKGKKWEEWIKGSKENLK